MSPATAALEKVSWLPEREQRRRRTQLYEETVRKVPPTPFSNDSCSSWTDHDLSKKKNGMFDMSCLFNASQSADGTLEFPRITWSTFKEEQHDATGFASRRSTSYPDTCLAPPFSPVLKRASSTSSLNASSLGKRRRGSVSSSKRLVRSIALGANLSLMEDSNSTDFPPFEVSTNSMEELAQVSPTTMQECAEQVMRNSTCFRSSASKTVNECLKILGERVEMYSSDE